MKQFDELDDVIIVDNIDTHINWGLAAIGATNMWEHTRGEGIKIAVIDTGVDLNHIDLKDKIKTNTNAIYNVKDIPDFGGHGTHVAGIIAGENTGVAPESELYIIGVLDELGRGKSQHILDGITFAINHKVDILCMSLGSNNPLPQIIESRLEFAFHSGITIVGATGNHGRQFINHPASHDFVIGVGGVNENLERAEFSNYGFEMDIVAPAVNIFSTYKEGKYAYMSGTSMAAPFVAGGIALIKSYYRKQGVELTPKDIMNMLKKLRNKKDRYVGYGLFNIDRILELKGDET